jgi:DNA-binding CsgD family transcriptional regulator
MRGREEEWQTVLDLLDRARRGRGGVVLVEGEPGIGKSRLLRESAEAAAGHGFSLATGAADQFGQAIPFLALRRALGHPLAGAIAGFSDHELPIAPEWWISQARAQLEERSGRAPVLVCLDDVHWACAPTLAALRTLPGELKGYPVAWLLSRSTAWRQEAGHLFGLLESDGGARIRLAALAGDGVTALLTDAFGAPPHPGLHALATAAAGNPWLLSELMGGLRDEDAVRVTGGRATLVSGRLPERMNRAARERLDGISKQARHVLSTAAVLGASFRLEDLARMLGETPAALLPAVEETMAAGITAAGENEFSFRHPLLRRAVGETIPPPGRRALHRQYGQILLAGGESAALAADHLLLATEPGNASALADLDAAAKQTLRSAPQAAADLAFRALELTPAGDRDALPRAVAAAEALVAAGRLDEAGRLARDTLGKPLPPLDEARLRCVLSSVLCSRGEALAAAAEARKVLAGPNLPGSLRDSAMTACLQALASARDGEAVTLARTVLGQPDQYGCHVTVAALIALAVTSWDSGRASEALELLREAARREPAVSPDARHAPPLLALAAALVDLRQLDEAETILEAADSRALRSIPARTAASVVRARIHLASGRLAEAAAVAGRALADAESLGALAYASAARCVLGVTALRGGDATSAARHLADGVIPGPHAGDLYARAEITMARAQVSEVRDGLARAVTQVRRAGAELGTRPGLLLGDPASAPWLTRTALAAGDTELAAAVAEAAQFIAAGSPGFPAITASAAHCRGLVGEDPAGLAEAAAEHPDRWARASAAEDLGLLHAGRWDHDLAVHHLTEAARGYQDVGAVVDVARIRSRLRKLGVRRRDWTRRASKPVTGWESLTEAELAAAELVAQGLSNGQVAIRMYVSVHTVAFYLRHTFRKLDIGSRVELARVVLEHQAVAGQQRLR